MSMFPLVTANVRLSPATATSMFIQILSETRQKDSKGMFPCSWFQIGLFQWGSFHQATFAGSMGLSYEAAVTSESSFNSNTMSKVFPFSVFRVQTFQFCTIFRQISPSLVKAKCYPACISLALRTGFQPNQAKTLRHPTETADRWAKLDQRTTQA